MSDWDQPRQDTITASQQNYGAASSVIPSMLELMFTCMMRAPNFFDESRRFIDSNQFDEVREPHYMALWAILCTLRDAGCNFTCANILVEARRLLSDNPAFIHPNFQTLLLTQGPTGIPWTAFNTPVETIDLVAARRHMREFLHERTVARPLRNYMDGVLLGEVPLGLDNFLDVIVGQQQTIQSMEELPIVLTVPALDSSLNPPSVFHPTGIDWIDHPLGGVREGDVIGIIGTYGSGKSTLAAHISVACAKREHQNARQEGRESRWVALLTYEEAVRKMQPRVWSAGLQILRDRLENLTRPSEQLTDRTNMLDYERNLYGQNTTNPMSEQDRWAAGATWMNKSLKLFDMSGSTEFPSAGRGYIGEIVACLDTHAQATGIPPILVPIDYAGICCRNYMAAQNMDDSRLRYLLSAFGDRARREIAERFGCTVVLLHQVAPAEGQRHATTLMHHSMAAESRAFAENLAACACIGNTDLVTGCRRLNWSKIRYKQQEKVEPVTIRINDQFAQMDNAGSVYAVDDSARRFVLRDSLQQVHGGSMPAQPRTATTNPPRIRTQMDAGEDILESDGGI